VRAAALRSRPLDGRTSVIPGLSARALRAIAHLERTRLGEGVVAEALCGWSWFVRHPWHRLWDPSTACGVLVCCPNPPDVRAVFEAAVAVLPRQDARRFRSRVAALDELW